jgi:peptidase E
LATASGDADGYLVSAYRAFSRLDCRVTDLALFNRTVGDLRTFVREQDVFWVGGGSTASLLAVWRAHGLDELLHDAGLAGAVLAGVSAGMLCWFQASITDSFGSGLAPFHGGLGVLEGSACAHFDSDPQRRELFRELIATGALAPGWAIEDDAAVHFRGAKPVEVLAARPGARAHRIDRTRERSFSAGPIEL